ncbi:MAG: 16S rRNA (cytosine(1402)-N(4))-methyltransferase RsmH [Acidobacteria bacterium]|nr:16S rRNA (cytosine(1402)-N(4))-methyltransferase RsmH [Acidobacteriota bacterium]
MAENTSHQPVLVRETLRFLSPEGGGVFVDCTLGAGGHSEAILSASTHSRVIGVDRDETAIRLAAERLRRYGSRFSAIHADFKQLREILQSSEVQVVDGMVADLGVSSLELESAERGFSFRQKGPLDMRMDQRQELTAADLVNALLEAELADIIYRYGEEHAARRIARAIVRERQRGRIETTTHLADVILRANKALGRWRIHPATRTFQALRIAVNDELKDLDKFVDTAIEVLKPGGRLVIISFHSLEDRIIKQAFRLHAGQCQCQPLSALSGTRCPRCGADRRVEILTKKPVQSSEAEIKANPRARSAKLRACRKLTETPGGDEA